MSHSAPSPGSGGGTGSGWESASFSWSYSGSGSYRDYEAGSGIAFFVPGSATPTIQASVAGTAYTWGQLSSVANSQWTMAANNDDNWTYAGSGKTTSNESSHASYSGSGTFTASGAVTGGGTIGESGNQYSSASGVSNYEAGSTGY